MSKIKELIEQIKIISVNTLAADQPAEIVYGRILGPGPTVQVSQQLTLSGNQIILTKPFVFYAPPTPGPDEDPPPPPEWYQLEAGDSVALLKNRHGQSYCLLGKV